MTETDFKGYARCPAGSPSVDVNWTTGSAKVALNLPDDAIILDGPDQTWKSSGLSIRREVWYASIEQVTPPIPRISHEIMALQVVWEKLPTWLRSFLTFLVILAALVGLLMCFAAVEFTILDRVAGP